MLPLHILSPTDVSLALGRRVQARRLEHGWTQAELASRSGVAIDTLKKFERTGQISLPRLVRLVIALGRVSELEGLLGEPAPRSLRELERFTRKRGRALSPTRAPR
ncbi:MAG: helix-turn-helix domain-containing protein [Gemmatimonadaceae bacterium]